MTFDSSVIAANVRRGFGDEDGAQITDDDLIRWINDAVRNICLDADLLQTKASANTIAGQAEYALGSPNVPTFVLKLRRVAYQGMALEGISFEQADELIPAHDQTNAQGYPVGTPSHYWVYAGTVHLWPAPATSGTGDLTIYYNQKPNPITALGSADVLIPIDYQQSVVDYCMKQAYELDANIQMYNLKSTELQQGLDRNRYSGDWELHNTYPSITSTPEYDLGLG